MTNREKLNNMAMYDLLCRMQSRLREHGTLCASYDLSDDCSVCVLDALGVQDMYDRCSKYNGIGNPELCKDCIAAWLNEEAE